MLQVVHLLLNIVFVTLIKIMYEFELNIPSSVKMKLQAFMQDCYHHIKLTQEPLHIVFLHKHKWKLRKPPFFSLL